MNRGHPPESGQFTLTLLGLVEIVQECAQNDAESVATLCHLFESGRARPAALPVPFPGRSALQERQEPWPG